MRVVFVHGACVRDGERWWRPTAQRLRDQGVSSVAARLPSCGEVDDAAPARGGGFDRDDASLRRLLLESDEDTILVAHSYGGVVAAQAAADIPCVVHIVFVSSYLPKVGECLADFGGDEPAPFLAVDPAAGTFTVRPERLVDTFMHDCDPDVQTQSFEHLADQDLGVLQARTTAAAWQEIPTTYVVCTRDRGTPEGRQREFARRADAVVDMDAGHHPFISRADEVCDLLLAIAGPGGRPPGHTKSPEGP